MGNDLEIISNKEWEEALQYMEGNEFGTSDINFHDEKNNIDFFAETDVNILI